MWRQHAIYTLLTLQNYILHVSADEISMSILKWLEFLTFSPKENIPQMITVCVCVNSLTRRDNNFYL